MPNEVTPTQADHALAEAIVSEGRGYAVTLNKGHSTAVAVAAYRIAHEAPLLARIAELERALRVIAEGTSDSVPPFRSLGPDQMSVIARAALATKDTPSHD